jgi:hypothetical protein
MLPACHSGAALDAFFSLHISRVSADLLLLYIGVLRWLGISPLDVLASHLG